MYNIFYDTHDYIIQENFYNFIFRSLAEIDAVLDFAKLTRDEIKPKTQSIYFSHQLDSDGIKLLELDKTVVQALENGERYFSLLRCQHLLRSFVEIPFQSTLNWS